MTNEELFRKLSHNKVLLYLIPHFIYLIILLHYYNVNFSAIFVVTFTELMVVICIFFLISNILYLILLKILKDRQKVFLLMIFIGAFYNVDFTFGKFVFYIVFTIILTLELKLILKANLDRLVFIIGFILSLMFIYNASLSAINLATMLINSKSYNPDVTINVDEESKTPNIYYIHCDGMMSFDTMKKYYKYDNQYLKEYLKDYNVNNNATLIAGHKTQRALVALFNPKYYDEFLKEYLYELEEVFLEKIRHTSYIVDYYELEEKRFNNELFTALEEKGYTTIAIGEYNAYTAFDVDYYYDYFNHYKDQYLDLSNSQFRLITNDSSKKTRKLYTRFSHSKVLFQRTFLNDLIVDYIPLEYQEINYTDFDTSQYQNINNAYEQNNYWIPKAILKGLDETKLITNNKFVFVDFNLNHGPYLFDVAGNVLEENNRETINSYLSNYIYSSRLLTDMVDYINDNDQDAIIIIQGDHGIHMASNETMMEYFNVSLEETQDIKNSVISAVYIPEKYQNGDELYLNNPLNISRYLVNNYVGQNYQYIN